MQLCVEKRSTARTADDGAVKNSYSSLDEGERKCCLNVLAVDELGGNCYGCRLPLRHLLSILANVRAAFCHSEGYTFLLQLKGETIDKRIFPSKCLSTKSKQNETKSKIFLKNSNQSKSVLLIDIQTDNKRN